jgi:lipocalin
MLKSLIISIIYLSSLSLSAALNNSRGSLEVVKMKGNYQIFVSLVAQAGLTKTLRASKGITIFAPSDKAFKSLDVDTLNHLTNNKELLREILLYHISSDRLSARAISKEKEIKTLAGKTVIVDVNEGNIVLNKEAVVSKSNIKTKNGFLHLIDSVLVFNEKTAVNDITTADYVDLERYLGQWYEIARYDNNFQKDCLGTRATYAVKGRYITVLNECQKANGKMTGGKALATVVNKETNAELAVSFVPILNLFGLFPGDYNILAIGDDYEYALVGNQETLFGF